MFCRIGELLDRVSINKNYTKKVLIDKIQQIIEERYEENITLKEMAKFIHLDQSYLRTIFKKETSKSYTEYRADVKSGIAIKLIQKGVRTADVAAAAGYRD